MDEPTPEHLIEALADAGEIDAGVEALEALRTREPESPSLVRLQARLFKAEEVSEEAKRAVLASWSEGSFDRLANLGFAAECAVAKKVLARVFPEEPRWQEVELSVVTEDATERMLEFEDTQRANPPITETIEPPPPARERNVKVRKRKIVRLK